MRIQKMFKHHSSESYSRQNHVIERRMWISCVSLISVLRGYTCEPSINLWFCKYLKQLRITYPFYRSSYPELLLAHYMYIYIYMYVYVLYTRTRDILSLASRLLARSFKLLVASTRFRDISLVTMSEFL